MSLGLRALQLGAGNEAKPSANAYHLPFETEAKDEVGMQTQVLQQEHPINGASLRYPPPAGRTELRACLKDISGLDFPLLLAEYLGGLMDLTGARFPSEVGFWLRN